MKVQVVGCQRIAGTSKATGAAFDMCNIVCLTPIENVNSTKIQIKGAGFKSMEIPLDPAFMSQFIDLKFPCLIDLVLEPRPRGGKVETVVVGIALKAS